MSSYDTASGKEGLKEESAPKPEVYEELVGLMGYVKKLIGRYEIFYPDSEDLVSIVYLSCLMSLPRFKGESSLKTWVYRVAVRRIVDYLRIRYRRTFYPLPELESEDLPVDEWYWKEELEEMLKTSDELTMQQKIIFVMVQRGNTFQEIARTLGWSVSYTCGEGLEMARKVNLLAGLRPS